MQSGDGFRTVWVSDVHLGSRACRIALFLDFLRELHCEHLYLVGDIIDLQSLRRSFFWPSSHTEALQLLLKKSRAGMRITYIPGNHDDDLRALAGTRFAGIEITERAVHTTCTGRRLLVIHGDELDTLIKCRPAARLLGSLAYRTLLTLNRLVHWAHDLLGQPYWSLAQAVKGRMGNALRYVDQFQHASLRAARDAGVDGVVCGHIHRADIMEHDGLVYCNDGDWVESCTALVEDHRGELALVGVQRAAPVTALAVALRDAA
jgi:UDP-2,3-diacylglucosamine pyrophosphatase LpxH